MDDLQPIENLIYEIRGQKVMIDRDLAKIYGVETRALNQAVKRNIERFPYDFMFQLTVEELNILKSQIVISNEILISQFVISSWGGIRKMPYVFTDYNDINEDTRLQLEQINQTLAEMQSNKRLPEKPRRKIGYFTDEQRKNNEDIID